MIRISIAVVLLLAHAPALAQQSPSHKLEEHAFNEIERGGFHAQPRAAATL